MRLAKVVHLETAKKPLNEFRWLYQKICGLENELETIYLSHLDEEEHEDLTEIVIQLAKRKELIETEFQALGEKVNVSLPDLPDELIMMIFEAISSKQDMCNLSTTCRRFYQLMVGRIWEVVDVSLMSRLTGWMNMPIKKVVLRMVATVFNGIGLDRGIDLLNSM